MELLPSPVDHYGRDICVRNIGLVVLYVQCPGFLLDGAKDNISILPGESRTFRAQDLAWWSVEEFTKFRGASVTYSLTGAAGNGVDTAVIFDTENYDTDDFFSVNNKPTRFVIPFDGKYAVGGCVRIQADGAGVGIRTLTISKNGTTKIVGNNAYIAKTVDTDINVHAEVSLVAGDYLELYVFQDSGVGLDLLPDPASQFWIHFLR